MPTVCVCASFMTSTWLIRSIAHTHAHMSITKSSADADKPARRVWRSVKVTIHSTVPYARYSFLLCNSNFVFLRYSTSKNVVTLKDSVVNSKLGIQYFSNVYARSVWAWHSETVWEGEGGEGEGRGGEGRSLPYQSKNRSRTPDCLCIADVHRRCHRTTLLFVTLFQTRYCSADKGTNGPRQERSRVPGTKVPGNESSMERTVQGTNVPGNE